MHKLTDAEIAILTSAAPEDTLLPAEWWARFLSLFLGTHYSIAKARKVLEAFNARFPVTV